MSIAGMSETKAGDIGAKDQATKKPSAGLLRLRQLLVKRMDLLPGILFLALWEYAGGRLVSLLYTSKPSEIIARIFEYLQSPEGIRDVQVTYTELGWGFLFGGIGGIVLGYVFGASRTIARIFEPYIMIFYGVPQSALAPLLIIWFGIGLASKILIVGLMVFFLTFYNTFLGVRSVEREFVYIAQIIGASRWHVIRWVVMPSVAPFIFLGIKISIPRAAIAVIIGEFVASRAGIGHYILYSTGQFDTAGIFAGIIVLLLTVLVANLVLEAIRSRVLRWQDVS